MTTGRLLARNSALNLAGLGLPILIAIAAIPPLVRGLGVERFGILTLVWAAIGYFSLFELGLGRALTYAVAQRIGGGGSEDLPALAWSGLAALFALGCLGAVAVAVSAPFVVTGVLNVPAELRAEAILAFYILAASLPFVVSSIGLRGLMEAHHHFGAVTALRLPLVAFNFLGPLAALPFSRSIVPAVAILVVGRAAGWAAHLAVCLSRYGFLGGGVVLRGAPLGPLLRYGGWTTITNVVSPMMVFLDRFLVGAMLPIAAVAHYVTPYEIVTKLWVIPGAILGAMFPAFAATFASNRARMGVLYERTVRAVTLAVFPFALGMATLAGEVLEVWIGSVLPAESALVLKWLAAGVFINAIGQVSYSALQGAGRPDAIAKLHVLELPFYAAAIWLLVGWLGLVGVAVAWTARVAVDTAALLAISRRGLGLSAGLAGTGWSVLLMMLAVLGGALLETTAVRLLYVAVVLAAFFPLAWRWMLTEQERAGLREWLRAPHLAEPPAPESGGVA